MSRCRPALVAFAAALLVAAACGSSGSGGASPGDGGVTTGDAGASSSSSGGGDGAVQDGPGGGSEGGSDARAADAGDGGGPVSCAGPFTITQQQPVACLPYPKSLWNKPLPADVMSHLAAGSDTITAAAFGDDGKFTYPWTRAAALGTIDTVTADGDDSNSPVYYGQATDPVYVIATCPYSAKTGPHVAVGKTFHAPSDATFSWEGGGDSFFADWDQTDGLLVTAYISSSTWNKLGACPGGGHAGTTADPCPVTFEYCSVSDWATDPGTGIESGDSLGSGGVATHARGAEMIAGAIHHAVYLETDCTVGHVFPAGSDTFQCPAGTTNKPGEGALFFLDYTPAQLADIAAKVPLWQYELLEALTVYGGYVGDTHGGPEGLAITRFEGAAAYNLAGVPYPLGNWLLQFEHTDAGASEPLLCFMRTTGMECEMGIYVGVPLETGPACPTTPCDVSLHMHLADPCIAQGLAGQTGGCN